MPFSPEEISELQTRPIEDLEDVANHALHDKDYSALSDIADIAFERLATASGTTNALNGRYGQLYLAVDYVLANVDPQTTGQQR